jgi:hypothetical protein
MGLDTDGWVFPIERSAGEFGALPGCSADIGSFGRKVGLPAIFDIALALLAPQLPPPDKQADPISSVCDGGPESVAGALRHGLRDDMWDRPGDELPGGKPPD